MITKYNEDTGSLVEYKIYTNPLELITQMEEGIHYDVIFLDICMPGINGIQCAKDIRIFDNVVKIIFLTSSPEYAVESYSVKAQDYLLKPVKRERLFSLLRQVQKEEDKAGKNIIVVKTKIGITKINLIELEYCEVVNRKLVLHLNNKEDLECSIRINELEEKLQGFGMFLRPHRSYLINMDHIQTLTSHSIIMENGTNIPVPREKYLQIKEAYMEYIFQAKNSVVIGN